MPGEDDQPDILPVGKLPPDLLGKILSRTPLKDPRVIVGPGIGLDCAVVEHGDSLLVYKIEPITFVTAEIGWYLVQVAANDIATTGATPRWLLLAALLPEGSTTSALVEELAGQVQQACEQSGISLIGGHTEVTHGLDRPILVGTLFGEVDRAHLVTPRGALPGDRILLTKGVPIEATAILAREFPDKMRGAFSPEEVAEVQNYLHQPGISVLRDAQIAVASGKVTAMHDPTEGGLVSALWELAHASACHLEVDLSLVPIPSLAARVCAFFGIDPLASIASGALLLTVSPEDAPVIGENLAQSGITCAEIGAVQAGDPEVRDRDQKLAWPTRDGIARLFESDYNTGNK